MKPKLTVCLIVKNEADHIRKVLESVRGADELVILDTGSTDNTFDIARQYTEFVYRDYKWNDDFAEARNEALAKCTGDWILSIDGDEFLQPNGIAKIREIIENATSEQLHFSPRMKSEVGGQIHLLPRLFRNDKSVVWVGAAHETLSPAQANAADFEITYGYSHAHYKDPDRMLRILEKEIEAGNKTPRNYYYLAREYYYRKDYDKAIGYFAICSTESTWNPEKSDALLYLARCFFYNNQGDDAREACLECIGINPDFKEALLFMADLHYEPWKHKWLEFAELAKNNEVMFVRV